MKFLQTQDCSQCFHRFEIDTYGRGCVRNYTYHYTKSYLSIRWRPSPLSNARTKRSTASIAPSGSSWRCTTPCSAPSTPANRTRVASIRLLVRQRTACPRGGLVLHAQATGHPIFMHLDPSNGDEVPSGGRMPQCNFVG